MKVGSVAVLLLTFGASVLAQPPATHKSPITDSYHGVSVTDDYRWLEDWSNPEVKAWSDAQNTYARSILDRLPSADAIRARLTELEAGASPRHNALKWCGGMLFAMKTDPKLQQPLLVVMPSAAEPERGHSVVDPNVIDPTGSTAIDWYVPSPDGKLVAVSMSRGGSESGSVHVFDVSTCKERGGDDVIPRAHGGTAGGSLVWAPDSSGFYYTRYPREGERPAADLDSYVQVYKHTLGQPGTSDSYVIGKDFVRIAEVVLETDPTGRWLLVSVQNGDGGEFEHHLRNPKGAWTKLDGFADQIVEVNFGDDALFLVSRKNAPRGKLLKLILGADDAMHTGADAVEIVPQSEGSIATDFFSNAGVEAGRTRLYVLYQTGGPNELRVFDLSGKPLGRVPLPPVSSVDEIAHVAGDDMLVEIETFITPPAWMTFDAARGRLEKTALFQTSPADLARGYEVVREFATSKDGTRVPISIIRSRAVGALVDSHPTSVSDFEKIVRESGLDLTNVKAHADLALGAEGPAWRVKFAVPTIVWGYGGYGVSEAPGFSPRRVVFLEQGGVYAVANIRGGGEYGDEWHRAGSLTNKQSVFDDFFAAATHMIDRGYTGKDSLALMGGSNGGLLMGATITQHPDLCKAVVSSVGIYDMLRVELSPNGAFNVTEFGSVKDKSQFEALYAYSPFHHVIDGTTYPSILMPTGANDPRVDPMNSRKMIARLQAADPRGVFLLRTSANAGHGIGSSMHERIEQNADVYAFLMWQLGMNYNPASRAERK